MVLDVSADLVKRSATLLTCGEFENIYSRRSKNPFLTHIYYTSQLNLISTRTSPIYWAHCAHAVPSMYRIFYARSRVHIMNLSASAAADGSATLTLTLTAAAAAGKAA
jgi:hypothetical protein